MSLSACGKPAERPIDGNTVSLTVGSGIDAAYDGEIRDAISAQLAEAGFQIVDGAAATTLVLDLKADKVRPGLIDGSWLWRIDATLHAKGASTSDDLHLGFVREARRALEVALWAKRSFKDELGKRAVAWAALQPEMTAEIERLSKRREPENLVFTRPRAEAWASHAKAFEDYCNGERARLAEQDKASGMTCVGDPCGQWTPLGIAADGRSAFVQHNRRMPVYDFKVANEMHWLEVPESVLRVPLEVGGQPETLFETMNLYGFGDTSGDGKALVVSTFDADGKLTFTRVDTTSGAFIGKPYTVAEGERASFAFPLATGMLVGLDPLTVVTGDGRVALDKLETVWLLRDGFAGRTSDGRVARYDVNGKETASLDMETRIVALIDGGPTLYVVERVGDGCNLLHLGGEPYGITAAPALETCIRSGKVLSDGRILGIAQASRSDDVADGDDELVLIKPATGRVEVVTHDAEDEETLHVHGQRAVFARRLPKFPAEHDLRIYRRQVCWMDIPALSR